MRRAICAAILLASMATQAQASNIVAFDFTGTVDFVADLHSVLSGGIVAGMPITGSFFWDLNAPGTPNGVYQTNYVHPPASSLSGSINLQIGSFSFSHNPAEDFTVAVVNDNPGSGSPFFDLVGVFTEGQSAQLPPIQLLSVQLVLTDLTGQALAHQSLPSSLDFDAFGLVDIQLIGLKEPGQSFQVSGPLDSVTKVPEPSSLAAITSLGLIGSIISRRRRKRA